MADTLNLRIGLVRLVAGGEFDWRRVGINVGDARRMRSVVEDGVVDVAVVVVVVGIDSEGGVVDSVDVVVVGIAVEDGVVVVVVVVDKSR